MEILNKNNQNYPEVIDHHFLNLTKGEYINGNSYYTRAYYPEWYRDDNGDRHCHLAYIHPLDVLLFNGADPSALMYDGPYQSYIGRWAGDKITVLNYGDLEVKNMMENNRELEITFVPHDKELKLLI